MSPPAVMNGRPSEIHGVVTGIPEVPVTMKKPPPSENINKVSISRHDPGGSALFAP